MLQVAEILAASEQEGQDVSDSRLRVQLMQDALRQGNYKVAMGYAITHEERQEIDSMRASQQPARGALG